MIYENNYIDYYSILFQYELDGSFTATHPELPGCVGTGVTMSQALFRLTLACNNWIEVAIKNGIEVPIPHVIKERELWKT